MKISVVIPALEADLYLPRLLASVESQTRAPEEIVVVDSSVDDRTEALLRDWRGKIPVVYHRVDFAYPGHARNLGVALARHEWIGLLDCRTVPYPHWLEHAAGIALRERADYVGALLECRADTFFKETLLAATYGNLKVRTLPGTLLRKQVFAATGAFLANARAGEDTEWMARVAAAGVKRAFVETPVLQYEGFPASLGAAIRKWHSYTVSNARINVLNNQKMIYICALTLFSVLGAYKWNHLVAHWREDSVFYIPNITKIFVGLLSFCYLLYRGLIRPIRKRVALCYLLPWRWLLVFAVGMCLDLAKAPGMILGALILLGRRTDGASKAASRNRG